MRANEVLGQVREDGARSVAGVMRLRGAPARADSLRLHDQPGLASQGAVGVAPRAAFFSARFVTGGLFVVLAVVLWRATVSYPTGVFDFYPLYYGAKAWLHGGNAYALSDVTPASHHTHRLFLIGNSYPLPAVLLVLPLTIWPAKIAAIVWLGCLTTGLLLALRLSGLPAWYLLYWPVLNALNLEQYTALVLILQLVALWALRERRLWLLAFCCTLILSKPTQGLIFVLAMLLLARHWRHQLAAGAAIWGGVLLLDPNWVREWMPALAQYTAVAQLPVYWGLAAFAIPLLLFRNYIGGAVVLQFLVLPFPIPAGYAACAIPLGVLDDPRSKWLIPPSFFWPLLAPSIGFAWATGLLLILPMVLLGAWRWWQHRSVMAPGQPVTLPVA